MGGNGSGAEGEGEKGMKFISLLSPISEGGKGPPFRYPPQPYFHSPFRFFSNEV